MKKGYFLDRFWLFGFGCATTRTPFYPQPQPQPQPELTPVQVMPRGELIFIILAALVMIGLIIPFFKNNKAKIKKARFERKIRQR
ncbi:hypothetical protein HY946_01730 [Candidatus Gottesmanbacteria bacterium]|nr:hypothetical protein [Candidatus Gottesmanbacteria bacterium]